jgi:hypothetical protein
VTRLFRLSGAVRRDPAVDAWFDLQDAALGPIARHWFTSLRNCGPDVRELMHDGCPVACVEDAAFAYTKVSKAHVNLGFYQGAAIRDPSRLLQGDGKFMRHVKLRTVGAPNPEAIEALILAAYRDVRLRLGSS